MKLNGAILALCCLIAGVILGHVHGKHTADLWYASHPDLMAVKVSEFPQHGKIHLEDTVGPRSCAILIFQDGELDVRHGVDLHSKRTHNVTLDGCDISETGFIRAMQAPLPTDGLIGPPQYDYKKAYSDILRYSIEETNYATDCVGHPTETCVQRALELQAIAEAIDKKYGKFPTE
jgi:hypothetical protein